MGKTPAKDEYIYIRARGRARRKQRSWAPCLNVSPKALQQFVLSFAQSGRRRVYMLGSRRAENAGIKEKLKLCSSFLLLPRATLRCPLSFPLPPRAHAVYYGASHCLSLPVLLFFVFSLDFSCLLILLLLCCNFV